MDKFLQQLKSILATQGELILKVKAVPGSSYTGISEFLGQALKIKVVSPPEKGKANKEIMKLLAETFNIPHSSIKLLQGTSSPHKKFHITNFKNGI